MSDMATDYQRRPITADEFDRMGDVGIFGPDERVELLEGELVLLPPMNPLHARSIARVNRIFVTRLGNRAIVMPQLPIHLSLISEPLPDFGIVEPDERRYTHRHPDAASTFALVECADTSLSYDRGKKLLAYARARIREYWIINLNERCIEIHRDPHELGYRSRRIATPGESIRFATLPDLAFTVAELLGPDD